MKKFKNLMLLAMMAAVLPMALSCGSDDDKDNENQEVVTELDKTFGEYTYFAITIRLKSGEYDVDKKWNDDNIEASVESTVDFVVYDEERDAPAEGLKAVTWTSSNPAVASITTSFTHKNTVQCLKEGTTVITAAFKSGKKIAVTLKVNAELGSPFLLTNINGKKVRIASWISGTNGNDKSKSIIWGEGNIPTDLGRYSLGEENTYTSITEQKKGNTNTTYSIKNTAKLYFKKGTKLIERRDWSSYDGSTQKTTQGSFYYTYDEQGHLLSIKQSTGEILHELQWSKDGKKLLSVDNDDTFDYQGMKSNPLHVLPSCIIESVGLAGSDITQLLGVMGCFGIGPDYLPTRWNYPLHDYDGNIQQRTINITLNSDGTLQKETYDRGSSVSVYEAFTYEAAK